MKEMKNYYEVVAKCGHVGKYHYVPIKFAVVAENGKEAAKRVRDFSRVKHQHKDAILKVTKIDFNTFEEIKKNNENDPYLHCHSKQEQNKIVDLSDRLEEDFHNRKVEHSKQARFDRVSHKLKKIKMLEKSFWEEVEYDYVY